MRKFIYTLFSLLFVSHTINAQYLISLAYSKIQNLSPHREDYGIKTIPWNAGILSLGAYTTPAGNEGASFIFYDTLGNLIWQKKYLLPGYTNTEGVEIFSYNSSSFYVIGYALKDAVSWIDPFLAKFNSNGNLIFYRAYNDSSNYGFEGYSPYKNDTFLVFGNWQKSYYDTTSKYYISKLDTFGNVLDTVSYRIDYGRIAQQVFYDDDTTIYVGGTFRTSPTANFHTAIFLDKYNSQFIYRTTLRPSNTLNEYYGGLTLFNRKVYMGSFVTTYVNGGIVPSYQSQIGIIMRYGSGKFIDFGPHSFGLGMTQACQINNNTLVTAVLDSINEFYFIDSSLNLLCHSKIGDSSTDVYEVNSINIIGNKIAGTGNWVEYLKKSFAYNTWNFLTQNATQYLADNCLVTGIPITPVHPSSQFNVFPNPFHEYLRIETSIKNYDKFKVAVFNQEGQEVLNSNGQDILLLKTDQIPCGIYFIKIWNDDENEVLKAIKQ